jgi:hypothetical protein
MKYEIKQRLAGTKQAYWTLRVWTSPDQECPIVHSGKGSAGLSYVQGILRSRYPNATKVA